MKKYAILLLTLLTLTTCESDDPIQFKLSTQVNPPEGGTISPSSGTFDEGEEITFTATPSDEYMFKNWSDDASGDENPMKAVMTDDMFITANFEKRTYPLTIEIKGEGTVKEETVPGKSTTDYPSGTTVQLTAIPEDEWEFVRWEGSTNLEENPMVITITEPTTWTAIFQKVSYALTVEIQGEGTVKEEVIASKSSTDYPPGTMVQLTAMPKDGWVFMEWSGDFQGSENPVTITIDQTMTITAKFLPENLEQIHVPDDNFEQALIDLGYDYTLDDYVYAESIKYIEELNLGNKQIKDLTGIEGFINLQKLDARDNELVSVIFTGNVFLDKINLGNNKLVELDLSALGFLKELNLLMNSLSCVTVNVTQLNQEKYSDKAIWMYDNGVYFSLDCNTSDDQLTYVPDDNFEQALIDLGLDDVLDDYVLKINILNVSELNVSNRNISDMTGLEDFEGLFFLVANDNNISSIPLDFGAKWGPYPPSPWAGNLDLSNNNLSELNISKLNFFRTLDVRNNPLTCIVASENQLSYFEDIMENVQMDEGVMLSLDCGN